MAIEPALVIDQHDQAVEPGQQRPGDIAFAPGRLRREIRRIQQDDVTKRVHVVKQHTGGVGGAGGVPVKFHLLSCQPGQKFLFREQGFDRGLPLLVGREDWPEGGMASRGDPACASTAQEVIENRALTGRSATHQCHNGGQLCCIDPQSVDRLPELQGPIEVPFVGKVCAGKRKHIERGGCVGLCHGGLFVPTCKRFGPLPPYGRHFRALEPVWLPVRG